MVRSDRSHRAGGHGCDLLVTARSAEYLAWPILAAGSTRVVRVPPNGRRACRGSPHRILPTGRAARAADPPGADHYRTTYEQFRSHFPDWRDPVPRPGESGLPT